MIRSLLIPLDGSEFSERSLPLARAVARRTGATLHLAHVHRSHVPDHFLTDTHLHVQGLDLAEHDERHRVEERAYLDRQAAALQSEGIATEVALLDGHVADELNRYAREVSADLIVITTHGHTGVNRMWLGSSADALLRHTRTPLVVLHPAATAGAPAHFEAPTHIVVALDGSRRSEAILEPVTALAQAVGARVTLVHIVSTRAVSGARISPLGPTTLEAILGMADEYVASVAERVAPGLPEVATRVLAHESSALGLTEAAHAVGADMIAIGTHGYGGLRRSVLGSVADKVLRSSPLPLLVQRPET